MTKNETSGIAESTCLVKKYIAWVVTLQQIMSYGER